MLQIYMLISLRWKSHQGLRDSLLVVHSHSVQQPWPLTSVARSSWVRESSSGFFTGGNLNLNPDMWQIHLTRLHFAARRHPYHQIPWTGLWTQCYNVIIHDAHTIMNVNVPN